MRTFIFKAYNSKRNRKLERQIEISANIWNHCIALHKRYYRRYKKHLNQYFLMKHLAKLKKIKKHNHWRYLGSQAIQGVVQRIDKAYKLFFENIKNKSKRKVRPPTFKKKSKYKSFTLKQAGYSLSGNTLYINKQKYRFFKSRNIEGNIKTLTVKRDAVGDIFFVFVTDAEHTIEANTATVKIAGMDFGLKTFLTLSDGTVVVAPEFFKQLLKEIKNANKELSSKKKGSNNRKKAKKRLALLHRMIANKRKDFHFKEALDLVRRFQNIAIEDLNLVGMKSLWGRKISDLGFSDFVKILEFQAGKHTCKVVKIDRFYPSSKECHCCLTINNDLNLRDRTWTCAACNTTHNRDFNAALNIERVGASTLGLGNVRPVAISAVAV